MCEVSGGTARRVKDSTVVELINNNNNNFNNTNNNRNKQTGSKKKCKTVDLGCPSRGSQLAI